MCNTLQAKVRTATPAKSGFVPMQHIWSPQVVALPNKTTANYHTTTDTQLHSLLVNNVIILTQASVVARDQQTIGGANIIWTGENCPLGSVNGEGVVVGGESPLGAPLSARFDLYRRICQGLVTAEDLLPPDTMSLSSTLQLLPATATSGDYSQQHAVASTAPTNGRSVPPSREDSDEKESRCEPIVHDSRAPPGVLHEFIKHVRPFSLCLEPSGPNSRVEQTPSATPFRVDQIDAAAISAIGGGSSPCREGECLPSFDRHAHIGKGGEVTVTRGRGSGPVDAHGGLPGRAPNPPTDVVPTEANASLETSGTQQDVCSGRGIKSATPTTNSMSSRHVKTRLHGKRKLPSSTTTAASASGDPAATTMSHSKTSNRKKLTSTVEKGARRGAKGVKPGGCSGLGTGGNEGWSSLTWKSARLLRKRMETANTSDVSAPPR